LSAFLLPYKKLKPTKSQLTTSTRSCENAKTCAGAAKTVRERLKPLRERVNPLREHPKLVREGVKPVRERPKLVREGGKPVQEQAKTVQEQVFIKRCLRMVVRPQPRSDVYGERRFL
jgi:hypothetical protein